MSPTIIRTIFYSVWFCGLILQAFFTQIAPDEAYYWMYSNRMDWGFFDHPPAIALMIKMGYSIFENEIGVRLIPAVFSTLSIFFLERLVRPNNLVLFFLIVYSIGVFHFIGFSAIPDSPLLFFFSIFLLLYRKFIEFPNSKLQTPNLCCP